METLLLTLHVLVCISLIIIVLLQAGKGAEVGATFGAGSSQTVFGASGGRDFMTKLTTAAAIIFMLTSLTLAYFMDQPSTGSIMPSSVAAPATAPALPTLPSVPGDTK
jgi:preprotein translocase subunit SecG